MKKFIRENTWAPIGYKAGWGNGYVTVSKDHPAWGVDYDDIMVSIHGGLTFGRIIDESIVSRNPELNESDLGDYMVGFDTAHWGDDIESCPKSYVQKQTNSLYKQLLNYKI